jgi:hypothetical protein
VASAAQSFGQENDVSVIAVSRAAAMEEAPFRCAGHMPLYCAMLNSPDQSELHCL